MKNNFKRVRASNTEITTIDSEILRDKRLSLKAKGFFAIVNSLPSGWDFSINGIATILKEGKTSIYAIIRELEKYGYCTIIKHKDKKGLYSGITYNFHSLNNVEIRELDAINYILSTSRNFVAKDMLDTLFQQILDYDKPQKLEKRIKEMPYPTFIKTLYWRVVSLKIKSLANNKCSKCGSNKNLQTHHKNYDIHGKEHLNFDSLICLCADCHSKEHKK